jgi:TRAP-type mannitol/chloroaromatic compound transport system permease large subunit
MAPAGTTQTDLDLGALPYVFVVWVLFALMIAFPQIVLWLPHYMVR